MIKTLNHNEINIEQWQKLAKNSPVSSFFQTKECYDFYSSLSFLESFLFGVEENAELVGLICGYIIADGGIVKRFFSRRAIVPGSVLLDKTISDEALQILLKHTIKELKNKAIYIELRNYNDYSKYKNIFEKSAFMYQPHLNFHVPIGDNFFSNFSESKRRQIRQVQKLGVTYEATDNEKEIAVFYHTLKKLYKNKLKLPLFPLDFFINLSKLSQGKILVVKHDGKIIGGMAYVQLSDKTSYEWFVCGDESVDKQLYPSVMATYAGIDYASKRGVAMFDFMGAGLPNSNNGVRQFKSKFGGELVEYGRFLYPCNRFLYKLGRFYIEKIRKIRI